MRDNIKKLGQRILPGIVYRACLALWRVGRKWQTVAAEFFKSIQIRVHFGLPDVILTYGYGLGDDLLCTAVLRELRIRDRSPLWMISDHPELFDGMNDVAHTFPLSPVYRMFAKLWQREYKALENDKFDPIEDRIAAPLRPVIAELCARAGVTGHVTLRPYLALSTEEKAGGRQASGKVAIQSSGLNALFPMRNKEWYPDRFQVVINALAGEIEFIQIGSFKDPALQSVVDLRGRTSLRQSAAILFNARLYIGNEGFLMHLARAAECPSVIVYGGRVKPWQLGYACNLNVYSSPTCSPCWRSNRCDFDRKCMAEITPDAVIAAVREMLKRARNPLVEESVELVAEAATVKLTSSGATIPLGWST